MATTLLYHMGVGRTQPNMLAAADALHIKSFDPGFNLQKAYMFLCERWAQYKRSPYYKSQFRRSAATWLSEGDYNNPQSWGDKPDPCIGDDYEPPKKAGPADWARDKKLNPDKYLKDEEAKNVFADLVKTFERKRMPSA